MTPKPSLPRRFFLIPLALTVILIIVACGSAMELPPDEEPSYAPTAGAIPTQPAPQVSATQVPAIPETRRLTLEFPSKMKAGVESDIVRLTLEVDDLGNITPTAQFDGNVVTGEVIEIPNLYATHNVTAEARFDIAGLLIEPQGAAFQPLTPGEEVTFYWSIRPQEAGVYRGTVWLHLNFTDRLSGEQSRMALSAQIVEIEAVDFFGFSVDFARTSGVVGSVLGFIVGLPFLDDVLKYLWNKNRKEKGKRRT